MTKLNAREVDEFWHRIELYVQAVAAALVSRIGAERANEQVIEHLAIVLEMMMDGTSPSDAAYCLDRNTKTRV
jgi:hypothetical protein